MNCPLCSAPLLFGSTSCPCGYNLATTPCEELPIELSYWEALRAYWRIYWPPQVVLLIVIFMLGMFVGLGPLPPSIYTVLVLIVQFFGSAAALYAFVPRLVSRRFRGFSLVVVALSTGAAAGKLGLAERGRVWLFLWWRQILAGMIAALLAMPLNALLAIMGLQVANWIAALAGVLAVGPIILKMLVGNQFTEFRIEARRAPKEATVPTAAN